MSSERRYRFLFSSGMALALYASACFGQASPRSTVGEFVDLRKAIPDIMIDLRYAGPHNTFGETLYDSDLCLLRREPALALARVQERLAEMGLQLVVWDAYRPLSAQRRMWEKVPDERYVANPEKGSRHNRGAAVDVTLANSTGLLLPLPTEYDDFSEKAHRKWEGDESETVRNAQLLERVMTAEGFIPLPTEWWHFDYRGWEKFPVLDLSAEELLRESPPAEK